MLPTAPLWSAVDRAALIADAERLKRAAASAAGLPPLLRGKRLALLSDDPEGPAATAFLQAATELGGQVARVRASGLGDNHARDLAALLGQLYDAIECQGLPAAELRELGRHAGVPVFDGIGDAAHPLRRLADTMAGETTSNHRHLLQALLAEALNWSASAARDCSAAERRTEDSATGRHPSKG